MSQAAVVHAAAVKDSSYLLRKLHSLSGIIPIGAFLAFHLFENMKATISPQAYETQVVQKIWEMAPRPVFYMIELGLIFVPILFHAIYGFWIWYTGQSNASQYPYRRNWMFTLQRWSGLVAFAYIAFHVWSLRFAPGVFRPSDDQLTKFVEVQRHLAPIGVTAFYLVGSIAAAFHLGNGLFGFAYSWGLAVGRKAQRNVEFVGWVVFLALSAAAVYALAGFRILRV